MDILYEVFRLPVPVWSDNVSEALLSIGKFLEFRYTPSLGKVVTLI